MVTEKSKLPVADGGGLRYNDLKNRVELVPAEWEWGLADVTTKGSYKYADRNWERGMEWSIMVGCFRRHILKWLMGERYDKETGCHHLYMAAWNILALASYDTRGIGEWNLPYAPYPMSPVGEDTLCILERVNSGNPQSPAIRKAMGLDKAA